MKLSLRIAGSAFLLAVIVLGFLAVVHQDARAARTEYTCCKYAVQDARGRGVPIALGVWSDGKCHCTVFSPLENPNGCPLYCPDPPVADPGQESRARRHGVGRGPSRGPAARFCAARS